MKPYRLIQLFTLLFTALFLVCFSACSDTLPAQSFETQPDESGLSSANTNDSIIVDTDSSTSIADSSTAPWDDFDGAVELFNSPANTATNVLEENTLTEEQKNAIVTLVQRVVDGYNSASLPLPVPEASEYWLNNEMPAGVILPQTVQYSDLVLSFIPGGMWQLETTLTLNDNWVLFVWVSKAVTEDGVFIAIDEAEFKQHILQVTSG